MVVVVGINGVSGGRSVGSCGRYVGSGCRNVGWGVRIVVGIVVVG